MRIVIAGGTFEASYIIEMFKRGNKLTIINPDPEYGRSLMEKTHLAVTIGRPSRNHVLAAAAEDGDDLLISLCDSDTDNFATCLIAKKLFGVKRCICLVKNPRNVEIYKKLGVDSVISSTYLLAQHVRNESDSDSLIKSLSLDGGSIVLVEAKLQPQYELVDKSIAEVGFPKYASISYIVRNYSFVIPNGQTVLHAGDLLVVACDKDDEDRFRAFLKRRKKEDVEKAKSPAKGLRKRKKE